MEGGGAGRECGCRDGHGSRVRRAAGRRDQGDQVHSQTQEGGKCPDRGADQEPRTLGPNLQPGNEAALWASLLNFLKWRD